MRLRALVLVVMALALAACTSAPTASSTTTTVPAQPLPAIDLSATPAGWVPVAYGGAQVSVPASWSVYYPGWTDCGIKGDSLYLGPATATTAGCFIGFSPRTTQVNLRHIDRVPSPYRSDKPVNVNGVAVYVTPSYGPHPVLVDYAPSIGVEVTATGPLARQIVNTLTRSPRVVALASGSVPTVPSSWHTVTFQGLAFASPGSWPVTRTLFNQGIGYPCAVPGVALWLSPSVVALHTDQRIYAYICPAPVRPPGPQTPKDGIQVDAGSQTATQLTAQGLRLSFSRHCLALHGLTACPAISPAYSILVLKVTVPGRSKPVYVSIGLAGNGMVARTILYSLRAA